MPVERVNTNKKGLGGYRVHNTKVTYYYKTNNPKSRELAYNKALKMLKAIEISKRKRGY